MIELYPIFSDAVSVKARTYIKLNQDAKAQAALDDYAAIRPKSPVIFFYRAVLASRAHNKKLAAELVQSLPPQFAAGHPDLAMQMAQIILDNGNEESAAAVSGVSRGRGAGPTGLAPQTCRIAIAPEQPASRPAGVVNRPGLPRIRAFRFC